MHSISIFGLSPSGGVLCAGLPNVPGPVFFESVIGFLVEFSQPRVAAAAAAAAADSNVLLRINMQKECQSIRAECQSSVTKQAIAMCI